MAATGPSCSPTRSSPGSPGSASSGGASTASGSPAVSRRSGPHLPRLFELLAPARRRPRDDHERRQAARARARRSRPRACAGSTSRSTRSGARRSSRSPGATSSTASLAGIDAALDAGLDPVKVNVVVIRGVNDDEVVDLAAFGRERGVGIRFIEFMPLDAPGDWQTRPGRPGAGDPRAHRRGLPARAGRTRTPTHVEPAARYRYRDGIGDVGVIASVTEPFCESCDRVRVTAEGKFRTCLFALDETDLRAVMRDGGTDDELADAIEAAVGTKWAGPPHRRRSTSSAPPAR